MECIIKKPDGSTIQMTDNLLRHQVATGAVGKAWAAKADGEDDWSTVESLLGHAMNDHLVTASSHSEPSPTNPPPASPQEQGKAALSKGMATTSLVLGILSLVCFGPLAGLPAIIVGHIAHRRARKAPEQYGGAGRAVTGFITGYLSILLTFVVVLPVLASARSKAQSISCLNNLKQISLAAQTYSIDNDGKLPMTFGEMQNELNLPDNRVLICPSDKAKNWSAIKVVAKKAWNDARKEVPDGRPPVGSTYSRENGITYSIDIPAAMKWIVPENISYEIVSKGGHFGSQEVFARCKIHGHVCFGDGRVEAK